MRIIDCSSDVCSADLARTAARSARRPRPGCPRHRRADAAGTLIAVRYALGIEYDGSGFSGWQRLQRPGGPVREERTLQGALEEALSFVAGEQVGTTCAGRTDAGVHARCQVVHFDSEAARGP